MHENTHHAGHSQPAPASEKPGATHRDPVCGMTVSAGTAHRSRHRDADYFFCSGGCKAKFERDPEKFTAAAGTERETPARPAAGKGGTAAGKWTCRCIPRSR